MKRKIKLETRGDDIKKLMLKPKNIYRVMVLEAIKKALAQNIKRILFQAGYAAEIAQWYGSSNFRIKKLITEQNIQELQNNAREYIKHLQTVRVGAVYKIKEPAHNDIVDFFVFENNQKTIKLYENDSTNLLITLYNLAFHYGFKKGVDLDFTLKDRVIKNYITEDLLERIKVLHNLEEIPDSMAPMMVNHCRSKDLYGKIYYANWLRARPKGLAVIAYMHVYLYSELKYYFRKGNAERVLYYINRIFDYMTESNYEDNKNKKIQYLQDLINSHKDNQNIIDEQRYAEFKLYDVVEPFLIYFNYHKKLMDRYQAIKWLKTEAGKNIFVIDDDSTIFKKTINTDLGIKLNTFIDIDFLNKIAENKQLVFPQHNEESVHNWYEYVLPSIFKKLNLSYKKTFIQRAINTKSADGETLRAYAWEITTPKEELKNKLLTCL